MKIIHPFQFSIAAILVLSCSSFDFLQYRENTGLYVVEKPDDYATMSFGTRIAASSDETQDYMAVSAGAGSSTLFYQLAEGNQLKTITTDMQDFPDVLDIAVAADAESRLSGASLTGLPVFAVEGGLEKGCMAIGEPGNSQVTIWCSTRSEEFFTIKGDQAGFGTITAPIKPGGGMQSLLVIGADKGFQVFSSIRGNDFRSGFETIGGDGKVLAAAGGRIGTSESDGDVLYVAAATDDGAVHLYLQSPSVPSNFYKAACLTNSKNKGFGGALAAGDLDGDGADELIVGSNPSASALDNTVRIFDVSAVLGSEAVASGDSPDDCIDIDDGNLPLLATLTPEEGDLGTACDVAGCGFGTAVTVGDIALDDDGPELIVGAFGATVDGVSSAGAVYIYRGWERTAKKGDDLYEDAKLVGQVADSTPESGKEFGSAVAIAPMAGRNELLISATGEGRVFIAFCTGIGDNIEEGADVPRNGNGKLVSTRCRL